MVVRSEFAPTGGLTKKMHRVLLSPCAAKVRSYCLPLLPFCWLCLAVFAVTLVAFALQAVRINFLETIARSFAVVALGDSAPAL